VPEPPGAIFFSPGEHHQSKKTNPLFSHRVFLAKPLSTFIGNVYRKFKEDIIMDFGSLGSMGGAVSGYLTTPEGQEAVKKFLASPQGIALLQNFAGTPDGQKTMLQVVGGLNLPPGAADMIKNALGGR